MPLIFIVEYQLSEYQLSETLVNLKQYLDLGLRKQVD